MRLLQVEDMRDLAVGAAILGTGGGGDPYIGMLLAEQVIREYGPVRMIGLDELKDDDFGASVAYVGAPVVMIEKLMGVADMVKAFKALERYMGRTLTAVVSAEIGGANSIVPVGVAAALGIPLLDADGMGRAFPEIPLVIWTLHGLSATPMTMADEKGNSIVIETIDNHWTERFARSVATDMGAVASTALYPASGPDLRRASVPGSVSRVIQIGKAIREAQAAHRNTVEAALEVTGGVRLFKGKITDVLRRILGGYARGECTIEGLGDFKGQKMAIHFQNENLIAYVNETPVAVVPDLITVLDSDTGEAVTTEHLRYGYRVDVIGIPCYHEWRTPEGIALGGPGHFGYDVQYTPVERRAR